MRPAVLFAAIGLVVGACGSSTPHRMIEVGGVGGAAPTTDAPDTLPPGPRVGPPPVRLRAGARQLSVPAWGFCWREGMTGLCADGLAPVSPPDVGDPDEILVEFAASGWRFTATVERTGQRCGRAQSASLEQTGPTTHRLRPLGPADDYVVTLFGRGQDAAGTGGDIVTSFRWHTPGDGPNEAPTASAGILSGTPQAVSSHGVELSVHDLRSTPRRDEVKASVLVTSSNGASLPIELRPKDVECTPTGSVHFVAPDELGTRAAALGPAPFRYDVDLTIDGVTYRGTATWPDDLIPDSAPSTRVLFTPPLPGL